MFKKVLILTALILSVVFTGWGYAAEFSVQDIYTLVKDDTALSRVNVQEIGGKNTMVLPSAASPENIVLYKEGSAKIQIEGALKRETFESGKAINLNGFCKNNDYVIKFIRKDGTFEEVRFLFSENIPAVFLTSDNPLEKGREWVEASPDRSNKATGSILMLKADGDIVHQGTLTQIKGRGNSTWIEKKKPYQIKTEEKVDLIESGNPDNKSKTWVLLANALDASLMNNSVVLEMGKAAGMKNNIESMHIDLYYDGQYRGNYLLAEKVEVGGGRVDVEDMEDKNEEVNEGTDIESLPVKTDKTENGAYFTYCEGMNSPKDITGGYLLEMDFEVRAKEEVCYFWTTRGQYVVVKSPEYASKEEMKYIATLYQEYEDAVFNGGINPTTGKAYSEYVDLESIAVYFAINEFSISKDFMKSSAYLYKNAGEDKLYMGPLWDYDLSLGKNRIRENEGQSPYGISVYNTELGRKLLERTDFTEALAGLYREKLYPFIKSGLFGQDEKSLEGIGRNIEASAKINFMMWHTGGSWEEHFSDLTDFVSVRAGYVSGIFDAYENIARGNNSSYLDVSKTDWFYKNVANVSAFGFMNGTGNNCFEPYRFVKRAEVAQVLYNMAGAEKVQFTEAFSDVKDIDWYSEAVIWAAGKGLITGFSDGTFCPEKEITREELAVIMHRLEKLPEASVDTVSFKDGGKISPFAQNAIEWAISKSVIGGDDKGNINPTAALTRAELATILFRYVKIQ